MKPQQNINPADQSVDKVLREWQVKDPLPPGFHEQVWRRIERAQAQAPAAVWSLLRDWIAQAMAQRTVAVSYVTLLLLTGLLAGYWHAQIDKTHAAESLSERYVQMMDPYQARH